MFIHFDADRPSDSLLVERVWRCHSEGGGPFLAVASSHWELVVTRLEGQTTVTVHGPETRAREVFCPPDGTHAAATQERVQAIAPEDDRTRSPTRAHSPDTVGVIAIEENLL